MICDDPRCTGNHNDRKWDTLCPRSIERKRVAQRRSYYNTDFIVLAQKRMWNRRYKALMRMAERERLPKEA